MLAIIIQVLRQAIFLVVLIKVVLSYFMDPFHPIRQSIDRLVDPLLSPIQRIVPPLGGFDFSPFILILLVELISSVLLGFL